MFSYGMVLYELLSGQRPALGQHHLQIAKKLSKGVRPALGPPEEVQFCCLHRLLTVCWDTKPEKVRPSSDAPPVPREAGRRALSFCRCLQRPLATQCLQQMQEPSFPCLKYVLTCGSHAQLFLSQLQGRSAVFWSGDKDGRFDSALPAAAPPFPSPLTAVPAAGAAACPVRLLPGQQAAGRDQVYPAEKVTGDVSVRLF